MTKEEFHSRAMAIYAAKPSPNSRKEIHDLFMDGLESFTRQEMGLMAAKALDESFPTVVEQRKAMGMTTATESITSVIETGVDTFVRFSIN